MEKKCQIYFDGACLPKNPGGVVTYGFVIKENGITISMGYGLGPQRGTNNIAEYTGLLQALLKALKLKYTDVEIYGDSQLVVNQINGSWGVNAPHLVKLYQNAKKILGYFKRWQIKWIPRELNSEADALTQKAYVEYQITKKHPKKEGETL